MVEITLTQEEYDLLDEALTRECLDLDEDPDVLTAEQWKAWKSLEEKIHLLDPRHSRPSNTVVRDIS